MQTGRVPTYVNFYALWQHEKKHMLTSRSTQARDATSCVNDLARKGGNGVQCAIAKDKYDIQMCGIGNAKIIGIKNTAPRLAVNW